MRMKKILQYISYGYWLISQKKYKVALSKTKAWLINRRNPSYKRWIRKNERPYKKRNSMYETYSYGVFLMPQKQNNKELNEKDIKRSVDSILAQNYKRIKLIIVLDSSLFQESLYLSKLEMNENITLIVQEKVDYSKIMNQISDKLEVDFFTIVEFGDYLSDDTFYYISCKLEQNPELDLIYTDEDMFTHHCTRVEPWMKPDWSPDLLLHTPYCLHLCIYRSCLLEEIHLQSRDSLDNFLYELTLMYTEKISAIGHISKVCYHRKKQLSYDNIAEREIILKETLKRRKVDGIVINELNKSYKIYYNITTNPLVSIVILSKDNVSMLKQCLTSIYKKSRYHYIEIMIIDNGSTIETQDMIHSMLQELESNIQKDSRNITIIYEIHKMDFNYSKLCNLGINRTNGEFVIFLNDDIEVISDNWIQIMVGQAAQSYVGAVGARLLYPGTSVIQHMGIVNLKSGPAHAYIGRKEDTCIAKTIAIVTDNLAVTGACLAIERRKLIQVGGFNEKLPLSFNDVELCFRLVECGYYNVVRNDVKLYHYESFSRKNALLNQTKLASLENDLEYLYQLHPKYNGFDPFYSVNLNQHKTDYSLGI